MSLIPKRPVVCKADDGTIYDLAVGGGTHARKYPDMEFIGDREIRGVLHSLYRYKQGHAPRPF